MEWIKDYWWIVLIVLAGIIISGIKELNRDNNAEWDDDDDWQKDKKK
jgi:type II secretory pathway component PulF